MFYKIQCVCMFAITIWDYCLCITERVYTRVSRLLTLSVVGACPSVPDLFRSTLDFWLKGFDCEGKLKLFRVFLCLTFLNFHKLWKMSVK